MTHKNAPALPKKGRGAVKPPAGREMSLLQDDAVRYNGEPIAVVVADTLEHALEAAARVEVTYDKKRPRLAFDEAKANLKKPEKLTHGPADKTWGAPDKAMEGAAVRIDQTYSTPMEHHNPMEPHATVALWEGERLTL